MSLAYITVEGADPCAHIEAAAQAGFGAAGLRALSPLGRPLAHPLLEQSGTDARIQHAIAATGVGVLDLEVLTLTADFSLGDARGYVDFAAYGARYVQVVGEDPDLDRAADNLAALAELAAGAGVRTALEFMAFRAIDTIDTALTVADRGTAQVLIDTLHLHRSGGTAADLARVAPERIAYVQLSDAPAERPGPEGLIPEARFDRLYPGEGGLPLADYLAALSDELPISVEVPHLTMAGKSTQDKAGEAMLRTRRFLDSLP